MRRRLRDILPFRKPAPPRLPISREYYLSVLAARAPLPALAEVFEPKGAFGRVAALAVPLDPGSGPEDLKRPMERGAYAVSSPDQKTLLKLRVFSKEEAGFDPGLLLNSPMALSIGDEARSRLAATWTIVQLTVESFDPTLYPALDFVLEVASRLAAATEGLVADPLARVYRMPGDWPARDREGAYAVTDHIAVHRAAESSGINLSTAGLAKFNQPELSLSSVPPVWAMTAETLLLSVAAMVMQGRPLEPGDRLVSEKGWVVAEQPWQTAEWSGAPVYELLPLGKGTVAEALREWSTGE